MITPVKSIMKRAIRAIRPLLLLIALLLCLCSPALVQAQGIPLKIYFLTNSAPFTPANGLFAITNGSLAIGAGGNSNVLSQPFPIWRDRGFMLNLAVYNTNSASTNGSIPVVLRFGSVHAGVSAATLVTNWSLYLPYVFYTSGPTGTNWCSFVAKTTVDNLTLGQLYSVGNTATNTVFLDPTNSYVGVYP